VVNHIISSLTPSAKESYNCLLGKTAFRSCQEKQALMIPLPLWEGRGFLWYVMKFVQKIAQNQIQSHCSRIWGPRCCSSPKSWPALLCYIWSSILILGILLDAGYYFCISKYSAKAKLKKHALQSQAEQAKTLPALPLVLADIQPLARGPPVLSGIAGSLLAHRALLWFILVK